MKFRTITGVALVFLAQSMYGQGTESSGSLGTYTLIGIVSLLGLWALVTITDNFMQMEAKKLGLNTRKKNFGIFPNLSTMFGKKAPEFATPETFHSLKKGADIKLAGDAAKVVYTISPAKVAVLPQLYKGLSPIPKIVVEIGAEVKAGDPLFFDKKSPEIQYTSPVSGEVVELIRGEKRAIEKLVILADKEMSYKKFNPPSLEAGQQVIAQFLQESGGWTLLNRRPYDVVPAANSIPRDIFISTFDSAPLSPDYSFVVNGNEAHFQKGLDVLTKLTTGKVYLGLDAVNKPNDAFSNATGVEKHWFAGKHPAGNVGVQIHHIKPIKSGDEVWTLPVQNVITIGKLFNDGVLDVSRVIAVTGNEVSNPSYIKTIAGTAIADVLSNSNVSDNARVIAGDVFSGRQVNKDTDFLSMSDDHITVISEGDQFELFGWLLPIKPRPSLSGTFPNFLYPDHKFEANTNTHGERRAFVVSGQYEEVLPMDIYPQHLLKAILANDVEKMEGLGIYELSEEDLALCEFACTSKMPLQSILRQGLEVMKDQE